MKSRSVYVCQQCGNETGKWHGRCPSCGEWNSIVETAIRSISKKSTKRSGPLPQAQVLSGVESAPHDRMKTGIVEFDRVLGGGIVGGSMSLLSGDPGVGKSTLLLELLSRTGGLYITGEESVQQVKIRAKRLGIPGNNISIVATTDLESILAVIEEWKKTHTTGIVVVDSIQTIASGELDGMAGSVGQVRYCGERLTMIAKTQGITTLVIGHVTKQGAIAGPKVLEHMVDTVLYLEGERFISARILRTLKNRFGAVEEVGLFEMTDGGMKEITNPSELFLHNRVKNIPGSVITVLMEGTRPVVVELQALTVSTQLAIPRRVANGVDFNRLQLIIAILQKHLHLPLGSVDIFVTISGGLRVEEPGADLAMALAIVSSYQNTPLDPETVVIGEMGLLGELRSVQSEERRIKEAVRIGYPKHISPSRTSLLRDAVRMAFGKRA